MDLNKYRLQDRLHAAMTLENMKALTTSIQRVIETGNTQAVKYYSQQLQDEAIKLERLMKFKASEDHQQTLLLTIAARLSGYGTDPKDIKYGGS